MTVETQELIRFLKAQGHKIYTSFDRLLGISSYYVGGLSNGTPLFAVGGERTKKTRIDVIVNAIHWCRKEHPAAENILVVLGSSSEARDGEVLDAIATLHACYSGKPKAQVLVDFKSRTLKAPLFSQEGEKWLPPLKKRQNQALPARLRDLSRAVGEPNFRWYRSISDPRWSGRVEGLEVCTTKPDGSSGTLNVGKKGSTGKESSERKTFKKIADSKAGNFELPKDQIGVTKVIRDIARSRRDGDLAEAQPEHRLEARILRGDVKVIVDGGSLLDPAIPECPFQFPTYWASNGKPRFLDALMRKGTTPWAVEIKVATGGQASYYRHGVSQAVLYREFIRKAKALHPWFESIGLKASECRAAVVFPEMRGPKRNRLLADLEATAEDFGVAIVPLSNV